MLLVLQDERRKDVVLLAPETDSKSGERVHVWETKSQGGFFMKKINRFFA